MSVLLSVNLYRADQLVGQFQFDSRTERLIKIGKLASAHIRLDDPAVARIHAVIDMSGEQALLIDMGSSSGTFVGTTRVNKYPLRHGEQITIGGTILVVGFENMANASATSPVTPRHRTPGRLAPTPSGVIPANAGAQPPLGAQAQQTEVDSGPQQAVVAPLAQGLVTKLASLDSQQIAAVEKFVDTIIQSGPGFIPHTTWGEWPAMPAGSGKGRGTMSREDTMIAQMRRKQIQQKVSIVAVVFVVFAGVGFLVSRSQKSGSVPSTPIAATTAETGTAVPSEGSKESAAPTAENAPLGGTPVEEAKDIENFYYYTTQKELPLSGVAEIVLWVPNDVKLLADANPKFSAEGQLVPAGSVIKVPRFSHYTVAAGDTLGKIAKRLLDDEETVEDIQKLNKLSSAAAIEIGMDLKIPALDPELEANEKLKN